MPDSLPPPGWGLAPFDERDLDAVLAGKTADVPVALRPVADVLAALCAGPVPTELSGEATAMAEFRALELGQGERTAGQAPTLLLEAVPGGRPARHRARPARRHPLRRGAMRPAALLGAAAAAVIVLAVLVTGIFADPFGDNADMASPSAGAASSSGSTGHSSPRVDSTSAAVEPTAHPSVTHSAASAQSLASATCRAYYSYYRHPTVSGLPRERSLWEELTRLARTDNWVQVSRYCAPYVKGLFQGAVPAGGQNQQPADPQSGGAAAGSQTGSGSGTAGSGQGSPSGGSNP